MKISEIAKLLDAEILCCEEQASTEITAACGSDMMSDVLMYVKDQALLLTGLVNVQAIKTAEMMDMKCVVFIRDKKPTAEMVEIGREHGIVIMTSPMTMYVACGVLYKNGLISG